MSIVNSLPASEVARVQLNDRWSAPRAFYQRVLSAALKTVPNLETGLAFKAEHVCGANFWVALSSSQAKLAGRCIAHMVDTEQLPLVFASRKGTCLRYERN